MTANPESIQQRYATIERLYSERQWPQVEALCESLLIDLPDSPADPVRQRVILLLGHTRLYGMGDVESARGYYHALLRTEADNTLRQIADQGLQHCKQAERQQSQAGASAPPAAAESQNTATGGGEAFPFAAAPAAVPAAPGGTAPASRAAAAAPWLESVDVVEEPEQIEVALADPQRREEIEVRELQSLPPTGGVLEALRADEPSTPVASTHPPEPVNPGNPKGFSPRELEEFSRGLLGVVLD
ncbi:conserved hypothetical protein [Cyanobium sp. PCC 7001]|uniref:hypothetical protein n=1 Tax=Cyanobium sp. PCC 7001 TaxID=180281 RepID=UPI0001804F3C|nr:hypothetical protein [Cyanobium sp. PCC 7001]EDY38622.1 conserved hypothetical protein [Cyanobium sp. PCC 7001]